MKNNFLITMLLIACCIVLFSSCNQVVEGIYRTQLGISDTISYNDYKYEIDTKNRRVFLTLSNDFMDGHYVVKRDDKLYEEFTIDEGLLTGNYITFHKNGVPDVSQSYINSVASGPYLTFYENGQLRLETSYKGGVRSDIEVRYDGYGNIASKTEKRDGVVFEHQYFNGVRAVSLFTKEIEGESYEMIMKYTSFDTIEFILGKKADNATPEFYLFNSDYEVVETVNALSDPDRAREIFSSLATIM